MFLRRAQKYAARYLPVLCAILLLLTCTIPAFAEDEGTADELFEFFLDEWVKPVAGPDVDYPELKKTFLGELRSARGQFGHLPEYWELRAHIDLREKDLFRDVRDTEFIDFNVHNDYYLLLNPRMLRRAIVRDRQRPAVLWNMGRLKALDEWEEWQDVNFSERYEAAPPEFIEYYIDGLAAAGEADPGNGYYPFFEASKWARKGDTEKALELFERAAECERFTQPAMFPASYALTVIEDFKEGTGLFEGLSLAERDVLSGSFYFQRIPEDLSEVRRSYETIIENSRDNWRDSFNILNSAACRLGKIEGGNAIHLLSAVVLVKICHSEALETAKETGDKDLEIALLALWHEAESIRERFKMERNIQDRTFLLLRPVLEELFEFNVDPSNQGEFADFIRFIQQSFYSPEDLDWADRWLTDMMLGVVENIREDEFSDKFTWHIFERIELFDYNDPLWWYVWWEAEGRNSPAKDDTNYRGICRT